ncbi:MAG: sugar phosphate isomerase/epimerase [Oscillospiraceae bacterium]|jgi:sugar phosphate isomerase/epimerase|nr:sugar phosphate isomerase/epimerase [Oscillospiraceae bacterium]
MLKTGLTSVTFRQLEIDDVLALAAQAGLDVIEWGGDVHAPPGALALAAAVRQKTEAAGLSVSSYGSYYRLLAHENPAAAFAPVLGSACALGAKTIRIWAGSQDFEQTDAAAFDRAAQEARALGGLAQAQGVQLAFEFHGGTITNAAESTLAFLQAVDHPNVKTYWQPNFVRSHAENKRALRAVLPWVVNIHVFQWAADHTAFPLADGEAVWREYLDILAAATGEPCAILEFVKDAAPAQFLRDAATLQKWLR